MSLFDRRSWIGAALLALLTCVQARAGTVNFEVPEGEAMVGVPFEVVVEVQDAEEHEPPRFPRIEGASVEAMPPRESSFTQIINNHVTRRSTSIYVFRVTPSAPGELVIPSFSVVADGRTYESPRTRLTVTRPRASDDLIVEILAEPDEVYVGQPLALTLRIWIKAYVDRRYAIKVDADTMWSLLDEKSSWGVFEPAVRSLAQRRQAPRARQRDRALSEGGDPHPYYVYDLERTIWPSRPGVPDVGEIAVRINYPLRLERSRDIFSSGRLVIADSRFVAALPPPPDVEVRPLPAAGRPASFRGAVGKFELRASAAPLDVATGDPVTLTLVVDDLTPGGADLATLSPPPLADQPDLTSEFRVSSDMLGGEVKGRSKTFTQTIRPLHEGIPEIPAIELAYFDPFQAQYRIARSEPIPITVRAGLTMDAGAIVDSRGAAAPAERTLSAAAGGLLANELNPQLLLGQRSASLGPVAIAAAAAPPLAFLGIAAWRGAKRRAERDPAGRRRRRAHAVAAERLRGAEDPSAVRVALVDWLADMLDRPRGVLTAAEAEALAGELGVPPEKQAELRRLLDECERRAYAPAADRAAGDLREQAQRWLARCEAGGA